MVSDDDDEDGDCGSVGRMDCLLNLPDGYASCTSTTTVPSAFHIASLACFASVLPTACTIDLFTS